MTVKVTKPQINLREKISEVDKPSGVAGEAILRSETPQEQFNLIGAGRKNMIINGDMRIWTRSTDSSGGTYRSYNSVDRFYKFNAGDGIRRIDTSGDSFGGQVGLFPYAAQVYGSQNSRIFGQLIEGPLPSGQYVFSAWLRFSEKPTALYMTYPANALDGLNDFDGYYSQASGGAGISYSQPYDWKNYYPGDNVWFKAVQVFTPVSPHLGTGVTFQSVFASSTNATMDVTGVQVEIGSVATPFEYRPYEEELSLCQRYFQRVYYGTPASDAGYQNSYGSWSRLLTQLQGNPSVSRSGNFYDYPGGNVNSSDLVFQGNTTSVRVYHNTSSTRNYLEGTLNVDAELG